MRLKGSYHEVKRNLPFYIFRMEDILQIDVPREEKAAFDEEERTPFPTEGMRCRVDACQCTSRVFHNARQLREHWAEIHALTNRVVSCPSCPKRFKNVKHFRAHPCKKRTPGIVPKFEVKQNRFFIDPKGCILPVFRKRLTREEAQPRRQQAAGNVDSSLLARWGMGRSTDVTTLEARDEAIEKRLF